MKAYWKIDKFILILGMLACLLAIPAWAKDSAAEKKQLALVQVAMCEGIKDYTPRNPAVVFSMAIGRVFCFTAFNPVPRDMYVYHSWFRRDRLVTTRRLSLKTPEWSTFSTIQLREADKGPWRVEIKDNKNKILKVLRFSITD